MSPVSVLVTLKTGTVFSFATTSFSESGRTCDAASAAAAAASRSAFFARRLRDCRVEERVVAFFRRGLLAGITGEFVGEPSVWASAACGGAKQ